MAEACMRIKDEKLIIFKSAQFDVYEAMDNSQLIKRRIDLDKTIFSHSDFVLNCMLSKEEELKNKEKNRREKQMAFKKYDTRRENPLRRNLLSIRRRSKTLDSDTLEKLRMNFYNQRMDSRVISRNHSEKKPKNKIGNQLHVIFFLLNYYNVESELESEEAFSRFFMDFYFEIKKDIKVFRVILSIS